jgi:hypothetical protein
MGDLIILNNREKSLAKASKILFQLAKVQSFINTDITALHKNGVEFDIALTVSPAKIRGRYIFIAL